MIKNGKLFGIPLTRRRTRRWLVLGVWTLIFLLIGVTSPMIGTDRTIFGVPSWWSTWFFVALIGLLGGIREGGAVREFRGRTSERQSQSDNTYMTPADIAERKRRENENRLDERDVNLRNAVHYNAYSALRWITFIVLPFSMVPLTGVSLLLHRSLPLILFLVVWGLPQTILLWTEPDMEPEQD